MKWGGKVSPDSGSGKKKIDFTSCWEEPQVRLQKDVDEQKKVNMTIFAKIYYNDEFSGERAQERFCVTSGSRRVRGAWSSNSLPTFVQIFQYFNKQCNHMVKKGQILVWGCRGWGLQAAGTWVSVSREMVGFPTPSSNLEPANQYAPSKKQRESWKARGRLSLNKSPRSLYQ